MGLELDHGPEKVCGICAAPPRCLCLWLPLQHRKIHLTIRCSWQPLCAEDSAAEGYDVYPGANFNIANQSGNKASITCRFNLQVGTGAPWCLSWKTVKVIRVGALLLYCIVLLCFIKQPFRYFFLIHFPEVTLPNISIPSLASSP